MPAVQPTQVTEASGTWIGIDDGGPLPTATSSRPGRPSRPKAACTGLLRLVRALPCVPGDHRPSFTRRPDGGRDRPELRDAVGRSTSSTSPRATAVRSGDLRRPRRHGRVDRGAPRRRASGPQPSLANFGSVTFTGLGLDARPIPSVACPVDIVDQRRERHLLHREHHPGPGSFTITYVPEPTTTAISAAPAQSAAGQAVTYSATVNSPGPTPTGTVAFTDGSTALCTATISDGYRLVQREQHARG